MGGEAKWHTPRFEVSFWGAQYPQLILVELCAHDYFLGCESSSTIIIPTLYGIEPACRI
jgi:hypothetical protein